MEREKLSSRLGFILLSAGCAIGCGNVWKFPTMTGSNGGGAFVLIYLIFLVIIGLPVMCMEFAVGRASKKSPARAYHVLTPDKKPWRAHGYLSLLGNVVLCMFYTVVSGWMLYYFIAFVKGDFVGVSTLQQTQNLFATITETPAIIIGSTLAIIILGFFICSFRLDKGLEKVTKYMMVALLLIMIVLAIYSFTLSGAKEGLTFYLIPDFTKINLDVVVAAIKQAFFTLSLGIGSMAIFGSYIDDSRSLLSEASTVIALDTFVAIVAGLIIFPTCFTYGVQVDGGPALIFHTLPLVFANLTGGRIIGSLFFLFMTFAAFSTILAVFENIVACIREMFDMERNKACIICGIGMVVLSLPCALSFCTFGTGFGVLNIEDFIVSNLLLPAGSLTYIVYCTQKFGWGWDNFVAEVNKGTGLKLGNKVKLYVAYILPAIVLALLIIGLFTFNYKGDIIDLFTK